MDTYFCKNLKHQNIYNKPTKNNKKKQIHPNEQNPPKHPQKQQQ